MSLSLCSYFYFLYWLWLNHIFLSPCATILAYSLIFLALFFLIYLFFYILHYFHLPLFFSYFIFLPWFNSVFLQFYLYRYYEKCLYFSYEQIKFSLVLCNSHVTSYHAGTYNNPYSRWSLMLSIILLDYSVQLSQFTWNWRWFRRCRTSVLNCKCVQSNKIWSPWNPRQCC